MQTHTPCFYELVERLRLLFKDTLHTQYTAHQYFLGYKDYVTYVGAKQAHVWVQPYEGNQVQLCAEYQSCGHNVLSTTTELIELNAQDDVVQTTCSTFMRRVDEIVSDTYAMRLMRY